MKLASLCILAAMTGTTAYAASNTTSFKTTIINETGKPIYLTHGGANNTKDPLLCPVLNKSTSKQLVTFALNASAFPVHPDGTADVLTNFYVAPDGSAATPAGDQSKICNVAGLMPHAAKPATPIACSNTNDPYIKYDGVRFDNYGDKPGSNIVILTKNTDGTYTCTLQNNPYSTVEENIPYRQLNVGQNYLPPGGGISQGSHALPTRPEPLLDLGDYISNTNSDSAKPQLAIHYDIKNGAIINAKHPNKTLLQRRNNQIFIQHNVSSKWFQKCRQGKYGCKHLMHNGQAVPNAFVIWTPVHAKLIVGPAATNTKTYTTVMPVVISNAIRAKTVSELVNARMLWLVEHKKIQDHDAVLSGNWLTKNGQPNEAMLAPDGADSIVADAHDYLAIPVNSHNILNSTSAISVVDLSHYFVMPHYPKGTTPDPVTYSLSAANLTVNDDALTAYGLKNITQKTQVDPIAKITDVDQVSYLAGSNSSATGDFQSAANHDIGFAIDNGTLTLTKGAKATAANLHGMYQINVKATDTKTGNSAYATFYVYVDSNKNNALAAWNQGGLPTFSVLHFKKAHPFGTAYLYTSYDFTKPYTEEQNSWKRSMKRLFSDLAYANKHYSANEQSAFVDINNIGFANEQGFWPVVRHNTGAKPYDLYNSITSDGVMTNLNPKNNDGRNIVKQLMAFLGKQPVGTALTIYPTNAIKAGFSTFNAQQRQYFADLSIAPLLYNNGKNAVNGLSLDFEGALNSVGATQFYKLLTDKLAYRGKWFSFFYFTSVATPNFVESMGPLGALEISTYDAATYRAPGNNINQSLPNTVDLSKQGYSKKAIKQLQNAYKKDLTCDTFDKTGTVDSSVSWCNNTPNQTISENTRLWNSPLKADFQYGSPKQTMEFFHGKFQLVLPVSWSATEWTSLYVWNLKLTEPFAPKAQATPQDGGKVWNAGLFMVNKSQETACTNAELAKGNIDLKKCLFANMKVAGVRVQTVKVHPNKMMNAILVSGLPGTVPQGKGWSKIKRLQQADYINANMYPYQDMLHTPNYVGLSAYSMQSYESIPSSAKEAMGANTGEHMTAIQMPWYVGFSPDKVLGKRPGYSKKTSEAVWQAFGDWMQK